MITPEMALRVGTLASALAVSVSIATAQPASISTADILANPTETVVLTVNATGVQVYECTAGAGGALTWTFKEPRADLLVAGRIVGKHYAGPTWEHSDGSVIKGRPTGRADAPEANSIPWLKLTGLDGKGTGTLAGVTTILRTNTKGGTASGSCAQAGKRLEQAYTSDYVFLKR